MRDTLGSLHPCITWKHFICNICDAKNAKALPSPDENGKYFGKLGGK